MFSSDTFTIANQMLSETEQLAERRLQSSKKRSHYGELLQLSFPRNSIVRIILRKNEKVTLCGSKKLQPDVSNFFKVIRSGPTNVQVKNLSDGTIKTVIKIFGGRC